MEGKGASRATTEEAITIKFLEALLQGVASSHKPSGAKP